MARFYKVNAPDLQREHRVPYYEYMGDQIERRFGVRPARTSLYNYLRYGFPVRRGGPYVPIPVVHDPITKRPQTTEEAVERWMSKVRELQRRYPNRS